MKSKCWKNGERSLVTSCREYPDIKLVAERVETPEHTELARRLGFDLVQGYAYGRTQVVSVATLAPSRLRRLELGDKERDRA